MPRVIVFICYYQCVPELFAQYLNLLLCCYCLLRTQHVYTEIHRWL